METEEFGKIPALHGFLQRGEQQKLFASGFVDTRSKELQWQRVTRLVAGEVLFHDIPEWHRTKLQAPTVTLIKSLQCCTSSRKSCCLTVCWKYFRSKFQTAILLHSRPVMLEVNGSG